MATKKFQKSESHSKLAVPIATEKGQPRIITSSRFIEDSRKKELKMPERLYTFDVMCRDDAVYKAIDVTNLLVTKALYRGKFVAKNNSEKSKIAAEFLNYCIHNMSYGTWLDSCINFTTALKYGFSTSNIVIEKRKYGKWKGSYVLRKLSPRDQKSVYGWLWNDTMTEWIGLVQKPSLTQKSLSRKFDDGIKALSVGRYQEQNYPILKAEQIIHIAYNSTLNNPQGDSPLMHCYDAWFEKKLIENYEISGISKDLNGLPVLRVPSELIERASDPENYPDEAQEYEDLQRDMADIHQGKTTNIVLTSDTDPVSGQPLYDFELLGVTGAGGKNYVTSQVIDQKRKSIYNCFGAGFLLLGQDGVGSYALSTSQTSIHGHHVERDIIQYTNAIDTQLAVRLLAVNDIYLDFDDMPYFKAGNIDEVSLDEASKFIQRVGSVNKLTPEMYREILQMTNLPTEGIDELEYLDKGQSRSGDGMKTAGNGTSNNVGGSDKSVSNVENGGVTKSLLIKGDQILDEKGNVLNEHHGVFNEEGYLK